MSAERAKGVAVGAAGAAVLIAGTWFLARGAAPAEVDLSPVLERIGGVEREVGRLREELEKSVADPPEAPQPPGRGIPVDVPPPPPSPPSPPPPPPPKAVKGLVLAADDKMDIFLVSVGRNEGLEIGHELTVYRGDTFVAVVVVDKVFADKAAASIKKENGKRMQKSPIRQGDKVASIY